MKIKDIERTANVAWSPKNQHPIYLAAGTAAQQLDASFNTSAAIEIYSLNLTEPGPDMQLVSSLPSEHRFHKIIWGSYGGDQSNGTIIGGCEGGLIHIYNASKLLNGEDALVGKQEKHTGPVHALDFNNFQQNLFATGAGDSEIFIWDLNNTNTPMSPGTFSLINVVVCYIYFFIFRSKIPTARRCIICSVEQTSATYFSIDFPVKVCNLGFKKERTHNQINRYRVSDSMENGGLAP